MVLMEIKHDIDNQKFSVVIDGLESHLEYIKNNQILNVIHTYVPSFLRGRGIAAKLVEAVIEYAKSNNFRIIPSCSYVKVYFDRHSENKSLLYNSGEEK